MVLPVLPLVVALVLTMMDSDTSFRYNIVKDSSADLGVNSKTVQIKPTVKAVGNKIS